MTAGNRCCLHGINADAATIRSPGTSQVSMQTPALSRLGTGSGTKPDVAAILFVGCLWRHTTPSGCRANAHGGNRDESLAVTHPVSRWWAAVLVGDGEMSAGCS